MRPCFYHQSHPQLGIVFALAPSLHSFWSYFCTDLQWHIGLLNCGVGEDSWDSPSYRRSVLGVHWKDWRWSWNSSTLATSWEELTHWKRPWCWEGLGVGGEGDNRGWDGWMASPTWWTWVWVNSGSLWWTGRPGVLQFMGSQRVGHDWATELNWTECWSLWRNFLSGHTGHGYWMAQPWRTTSLEDWAGCLLALLMGESNCWLCGHLYVVNFLEQFWFNISIFLNVIQWIKIKCYLN